MKIILMYWKGYIKETFSFDITTSKVTMLAFTEAHIY